MAVPPTAEGVIAEPNSHNKIILIHCFQDNSAEDKILILNTYPISRKISITKAKRTKYKLYFVNLNKEKSI